MGTARAAAVVTWVYVGGFGVATAPVAVYLLTQGHLPSFLGLFDMYGGPWSSRYSSKTFVVLLAGFGLITVAVAVSGRWLWRGRRAGAVLNLALLPVEAIFWLGFALPLPWLCGAIRVVLIAAGWRSLEPTRSSRVSLSSRP